MNTNDSILLIGNLTMDHNQTETGSYRGPGGSVYFMGMTLYNLGMRSTILSPRGKHVSVPFPPSILLLPSQPTSSDHLEFHNYQRTDGTRTQVVLNSGEGEFTHDIWSLLPNPLTIRSVVLASVLPNIPLPRIKFLRSYYPNVPFLLLPQGYFRRVDTKGNVHPYVSARLHDMTSFFNIVIASYQDHPSIGDFAQQWIRKTPSLKVILTDGANGADVYSKSSVLHTPAFRVSDIVDSTGSGDMFAAGFLARYLETHDLGSSVRYGHAVAGFSLRLKPDQLQYAPKDIDAFTDTTEVRN